MGSDSPYGCVEPALTLISTARAVNGYNHKPVAPETRQAASLQCDDRLFRGWLLLQPLQHGGYDQRQAHGRVHKNFPKLPTFCRRHKLTPRHRLAVRTA